MAFFDSTPTGRILNRFSKDLDDVDVGLPTTAEQLLDNLFLIFFSLGVVAYVVPYFLIPMAVIMVFYVRLIRYFRPTQRDTKRIDNVTRSPLFSHLTATLQGLPTLHAFGREKTYTRLLCERLDDNTRSFYSFWCTLSRPGGGGVWGRGERLVECARLFRPWEGAGVCVRVCVCTDSSRWFAHRLDLVTIAMVGAVALLVVLLRDSLDPALAGLGLLCMWRGARRGVAWCGEAL
jgi:ABC-type multidrug transport system fused ATPase/permease subunit